MKHEIKLRMRLKMKLDSWGSYSKGDIDTFYFSLLDERNGLLKYPIDFDKWEIVSCDRYTGLDSVCDEIYEGDIIKSSLGTYVVEFTDGCFHACNVEYEDNVPLYVHNEGCEIIGNIHKKK
jgi:hypothetical protein